MKISLFIIIVLAAPIRETSVSAQPAQDKCPSIEYSTPDASAQTHKLSRIEGQTVYASPQQKWEAGPAVGVCVVAFDKNNKARIASAASDDKGQFEMSEVGPGEYTLVIAAGELQVLSIPVQLRPDGQKSGRLLLHLREKEDKRKSYVTFVTQYSLREELLAMVEEDQKIRNEMIANGMNYPSRELQIRMDAIDRKNILRMKSIIKQYGWPSSKLVGWDGSEAAFVLVQHAAHAAHRAFLPLLQKEFRQGNLSGPNYALFVDRVLVEDGKLQRYGSRALPFDRWKDGEPALYPIADEANVDKRRAEVGLSPLSEYREMLKQMYRPDKRNE